MGTVQSDEGGMDNEGLTLCMKGVEISVSHDTLLIAFDGVAHETGLISVAKIIVSVDHPISLRSSTDQCISNVSSWHADDRSDDLNDSKRTVFPSDEL